jgi:hypothetical protein
MWVPEGKAVVSALTLALNRGKPVRATCVDLPDKWVLEPAMNLDVAHV